VATAEWKRGDLRHRRNVVRVSQEWMLEEDYSRKQELPIFQIAGAAEQKPQAPNEMLRVRERRLAEAHCKVLHGVCHWIRLAKYGGANNNNNNSKTMFTVLSSWQSHCESSLGSFDECRMAPSGR